MFRDPVSVFLFHTFRLYFGIFLTYRQVPAAKALRACAETLTYHVVAPKDPPPCPNDNTKRDGSK